MADVQQTENRVVAHFDIDCFYAQSEELRCPSLRGSPVGVTQKFLVVTSNYVARSLGVPKMVSIAEAKKALPSLVLVNGEDLTPYRADSKHIMSVLRRFGRVERHGLDEGAVDITAQVMARLQSGPPTLSFCGHVIGLDKALGTSDTLFNFESMQLNLGNLPAVDVSLLMGSQVVAEMRTCIEKETGFRCSCGIAQNKMLAKLSSSRNKPSMQTCLLQGAVPEFLAPMTVRRIPGVGKKRHDDLAAMNVETIADLGKVTWRKLSEKLGDRTASFLFNAARGQDPRPVEDTGPPKSITVEDSFRHCPTMQHAVEILRVLAPDLIRRLDEDQQETGRRPKSFTMKWRLRGANWSFKSVSTQMPLELLQLSVTVEKRAFLAVDVAVKLLSRSLQEPFQLVVLNIGATNFESASPSPGVCDIRSFLQGKGKSPEKELKVISKRDARANREGFKLMANHEFFAGGPPPHLTSQASKEDMECGPLRKLQPWNVASDSHFQDEYHVSNSSEDEGVDDLADQLQLSRRRSSLEEKRDKTTRIQTWPSELQQKEHSQVQESKLLNRLWVSTSSAECSSVSPVFSAKGDRSTQCIDLSGANPVRESMSMGNSFSPSKVGSQVPLCKLPKHHCEADESAPSPRELLGTPLKQVEPIEQHCAPLNISRSDTKDILYSRSGKNLRSVDPCKTTQKGLKEIAEASIVEISNLSHYSGTELLTICDECGEEVENTPSGRQEHADYHFALNLDKQERSSLPQSQGSSRVPSTTKRDRVVHSTPLKKPKLWNGTLDKFVVRRP